MIIISFLLLILGLACSWFSSFVSYIVDCLFEIYFHFSFRIFNCGVCVYTQTVLQSLELSVPFGAGVADS